ncbi:MAG: homoserine kinase [Deltaproteobacteria bacterium]|nr:homoserine kinase [Deltaproteobacteria bacterium]
MSNTDNPRIMARVFAPASVANLGLGFDVLGLALEQPGDIVTASKTSGNGVVISKITGDNGRLPGTATENTASIAATATLKKAGLEGKGVELVLEKGLPIGSGLGSSAASAAAAAVAVNELFGRPLKLRDLLLPCVEAEEAVSGRHADNVAASLLGGLVLVRSVDPIDCIRLPVPRDLSVVVVVPSLELSTRTARKVVPRQVEMKQFVANTANLAALVSALHSGDLGLLARCLPDQVVTPARERLIPGCAQVMDAALDAGALSASISGAGPSLFALACSKVVASEVALAMESSFMDHGVQSRAFVSPVDCPGARLL